MSETADVATNLPAIILLSFWWALLSVLDLLSPSRQPGRANHSNADHLEDKPSPSVEPRFPELRVIDPAFSAVAFLEEAQRTYEAVLEHYALGNTESLRPLLSVDVLRVFAQACADRARRGDALELTLVEFESVEITSVEVGPEAIEIAVLFRTQLVSSERSSAGDVIRGDPAAIAPMADLWTFSRAVPIESAAWFVIATDGASA
jgi:predicted lipid-binding transport protein (Tim44 family)